MIKISNLGPQGKSLRLLTSVIEANKFFSKNSQEKTIWLSSKKTHRSWLGGVVSTGIACMMSHCCRLDRNSCRISSRSWQKLKFNDYHLYINFDYILYLQQQRQIIIDRMFKIFIFCKKKKIRPFYSLTNYDSSIFSRKCGSYRQFIIERNKKWPEQIQRDINGSTVPFVVRSRTFILWL